MANDGGNPEANFIKIKTKSGFEYRGAKSRAELKTDKSKLAEMTKTDFLTGIPNRLQFEIDLKASISNFERNGVPFTIINIDLKDFKKINDDPSLGHPAGDKALKFFAGFLVKNVRALDRTCRLGGDEFLIILGETNQKEGDVVLEHLRDSLKNAKEILGTDKKIMQKVNMNASVKQWRDGDTYG